MTVKEAAHYLKLNYMTVYKLAQKSRIPASKIGGNWRFNKEIIDKWLNDQCRKVEKSVLVVDDNAGIRETLNDIISDSGLYRVTVAESGERALEAIEKQSFDLIFLDLVLPGLSGLDVFKEIKQRNDKTIVVIVTGYGDDPIALEAMSLGPLLLIRKPCSVADIKKVLNMVAKAIP